MRLYVLPRCPFGHRAHFALSEKQLPFDLVFFDRARRPPELEAIGPRAKSPTLIDGDVAVHDSPAVLEYIEERFPDRPLLPADPRGRAAVRMQIARFTDELAPLFGAVIFETLFTPRRDEARIAAAKAAFLAGLAPWDHHLDGRTYLAGDALSLADVTRYTIFPAVCGAAELEVGTDRPHLRAWIDRIAARPAAKLPLPA